MHRLDFSTYGSPSALLGTGKTPSEIPDFIWGPCALGQTWST